MAEVTLVDVVEAILAVGHVIAFCFGVLVGQHR